MKHALLYTSMMFFVTIALYTKKPVIGIILLIIALLNYFILLMALPLKDK